MMLSEARDQLFSVLVNAPYQGRWKVQDQARITTVHAPGLLVRIPVSATDVSFDRRAVRFNLRFIIDHATELAQYDELLRVLEPGGDIDVIADALATSALEGVVNPDGGALSVDEELLGQLVAPYVDVVIEVWL